MSDGTSTVSYSSARLVVPSDSVPQPYKAFFAQVAGNITLKGLDGTSILLTAVPIYTVIPIACSYIMATGTTSTGIIGLQ